MKTVQSELAAPLPESMKVKVFYHGCQNELLAQQILASGILKAPDLTGRKGFLKPMAGKVYLTADLPYAIIYALGGDVAGHSFPESQWAGSPIGYLFTVAADSLHDIGPDEDLVGEFLGEALNIAKLKAMKPDDRQYDSYTKFHGPDARTFGPSYDLWRDEHLYGTLYNYARTLGDMTRRNLRDGDIAWQARAGKTAIKKLPDWVLLKIAEKSGTVAHTGDVRFAEAWKVDKARSGELIKDGSNFFDVAEKIR